MFPIFVFPVFVFPSCVSYLCFRVEFHSWFLYLFSFFNIYVSYICVSCICVSYLFFIMVPLFTDCLTHSDDRLTHSDDRLTHSDDPLTHLDDLLTRSLPSPMRLFSLCSAPWLDSNLLAPPFVHSCFCQVSHPRRREISTGSMTLRLVTFHP